MSQIRALQPTIQPLDSTVGFHWKAPTLPTMADLTHFGEEFPLVRTKASHPLEVIVRFSIRPYCAITSAACHPPGNLLASSPILESTTLRITSFGQKLAPSHHPPTISSHHQTCANLISPVLRPLGSLWGGSQRQKANLYSFAHLVCCCLLSMVWDRLLASRRQTLVHAGLLSWAKKYQD